MPERIYDTDGKYDTGTLVAEIAIAPGEKKKARFVLSWNVPNNYNYWNECKNDDGSHKTWKNYYATIFENSAQSAEYSLKNWEDLYSRTLKFKNALHETTMPEEVIDAASSNLAVLKSPTVLRLEDGSFYGWEGVNETVGSCEGTCQHVWNYAYALCFLFPELERSIRELEFKYNTYESGGMEFRLRLPLGREFEGFRPCVDGQMGAVIKCYREWKISGDSRWLEENWENICRVLEYAWNEFECGSNYARSMASYALIPILSGFEFDMPQSHIGFNPYTKNNFKCVWSLADAWGAFEMCDNTARIYVYEGEISLKSVGVKFCDKVSGLKLDGENTCFELKDGKIYFKQTSISDCVEIIL